MPEKFDRAAFEKLTAGQEEEREGLTKKQAGERGAFMAGVHEQANKDAAALSELARKAEEIKGSARGKELSPILSSLMEKPREPREPKEPRGGEIKRAIQVIIRRGRQIEKGEKSWTAEREGRYEELNKEFNRQVENLVNKGFPKLAGMDEEKFVAIFEPLKEHLKELSSKEFKEGRIPFVIVPGEKLLSLEKKIPLMEVDGEKGFTTFNLLKFKTAEGVKIPESTAYLIVDVENGKVMLDKSPNEAVRQFKKEGRFPLTAEEGVALILQRPEILKDHDMDLSGSYPVASHVAFLWLSGGEPELEGHWADFPRVRSGARHLAVIGWDHKMTARRTIS